MITVFYDGKCGLCRREIAHYRQIAPAGRFDWVDITTTPKPFTALGLRVEDGLRVLHARDGSGRLHRGVDAFIAIWSGLPRWWVLGRLGTLPLIHPLLIFAYRRFADWRFKRLGYGSCDL